MVGGEWGGLAASADEGLSGRTRLGFIWKYDPASMRFRQGPIDPHMVDALLECARADATETFAMPGGETIPVVKCALWRSADARREGRKLPRFSLCLAGKLLGSDPAPMPAFALHDPIFHAYKRMRGKPESTILKS